MMLADERHELIRRELARRGRVEVTAFAAAIGCSQMTIRRDLEALAAAGELQRIRGGAVALAHPAAQTVDAPLGTFGLIVPNSRRYLSRVVRGAVDAAKDAGFQVVIGSSQGSVEEEARQIRHLSALDIDALMLVPTTTDTGAPAPWDELSRVPASVVVIDPASAWAPAQSRADVVAADHRAGARLAVEHLAGRGHERIALLALDAATSTHLGEGYDDALRAHGLDDSAPRVLGTEGRDPEATAERIRLFLDECLATGVRAALVAPDEAGTALIAELRARKLDPRRDLEVISHGDDAAHAGEGLAVVALPARAVGAQAVETCVRRLAQSDPAPPRRVTIAPHLVTRETPASTENRRG
ncbi:LacI family DNA-binding transcriptional regulator [Streptomyces sp. AC495_CC817]|uniref:LacI family DNA-binding transcriptional regulator n=1 Tax=Streptomyces sp. AC495_CC817 TaxID=2823900 RepID=UPI001C25EBF8|nr:LacI family DNA-binding transcriptional regulator [Streptomyces sp. AC495_CC817]